MNDQTIEQESQAKGKTAARVTPADIEANIKWCHYFTALDGVDGHFRGGPEAQFCNAPALSRLTFCVLVLQNGFTVTGESHCQDQAKFNAQTGRDEARKDAINKLWPMAVYAASSKLAGS